MESFGNAIRRLRQERGMSLRELARRARVDPGHLSRVEAGTRPASPAVAAALGKALDADGTLPQATAQPVPVRLASEGWGRADADRLAADLLAEPPSRDNALHLAHEWLIVEPPQIYEMRAGRRINAATVQRVEDRVQQLRLLDDHAGGLDTYELVTTELAATIQMLREAAYTESVGRRLLAAVAELCQVAGWVAADSGQPAAATRYYLAGVRAAHAAGDEPGAANNLSSLAYQVATIGDRHQAVTLAASAARGADRTATPLSRALLLERLAWAHARADEPTGADRALGRVDEAFNNGPTGEDRAWTYWLNADEVAIMAGRCWTELHRPLRAVPILERATAGYGQDTARESALYLSWLAEAYIQANEVEQAVATAERALALSRASHSTRSADRVHRIRELLQPHRALPVVAAFEEACRV